MIETPPACSSGCQHFCGPLIRGEWFQNQPGVSWVARPSRFRAAGSRSDKRLHHAGYQSKLGHPMQVMALCSLAGRTRRGQRCTWPLSLRLLQYGAAEISNAQECCSSGFSLRWLTVVVDECAPNNQDECMTSWIFALNDSYRVRQSFSTSSIKCCSSSVCIGLTKR
jgi:hypothetical protein